MDKRHRSPAHPPWRPLLALLSALACLGGCRPGGVRELEAPVILQASLPALPAAWSLAAAAPVPYLVYHDRDTRALVLAALDGSSPPLYLDRIADLPGQDPRPGAHLLFGGSRALDLLYLDGLSDDRLALKHVRRDAESGTIWIDVLGQTGRPVAAFAAEDGGLDLFLEKSLMLLRHGPQSELLRAPFQAAGRAALLEGPGFRGFTVFDQASHRLLLFRVLGAQVEQRELARFGQAQDAVLDPRQGLLVAAYDPRGSRIHLFRSLDSGSGFSDQPVTLSRGTVALALVPLAGGPGFLFNELSAHRERPHQLSLLHPASGGGYRKTILHRSRQPITEVQAAPVEGALLVAFLEESLRVLRVDYRALEER